MRFCSKWPSGTRLFTGRNTTCNHTFSVERSKQLNYTAGRSSCRNDCKLVCYTSVRATEEHESFASTPLQFDRILHIKIQQKLLSQPKRYNKIRCFEQRPFVANLYDKGTLLEILYCLGGESSLRDIVMLSSATYTLTYLLFEVCYFNYLQLQQDGFSLCERSHFYFVCNCLGR